jgi:hypothetical protein
MVGKIIKSIFRCHLYSIFEQEVMVILVKVYNLLLDSLGLKIRLA